jgi:hypothetical protein
MMNVNTLLGPGGRPARTGRPPYAFTYPLVG